MNKFINSILNFFFPEKLKCMFCGRDVPDFDTSPLCDACTKEKFFNCGNRCKICDVPLPGENNFCEFCKKENRIFESAHTPFIYEGKVRSAIIRLKSNNAKYLAAPMAKLMYKRLIEDETEFDVVIPVPSSPKSMKKRGYNHAELLATEIAKLSGKPIITDLLLKTKDTANQKDLSYDERQSNLVGAFSVKDANRLSGLKVLLVDDVLTTCATASRCSALLRKHASCIVVSCFARDIIKTK